MITFEFKNVTPLFSAVTALEDGVVVATSKETHVKFDLVATSDEIEVSETFQLDAIEGETAERSAEILTERYNLRSQLEMKVLVMKTPVYVQPAPPPAPSLEQVQAQLVEMVDARASFIISQLTKFKLEHEEREKAAMEFKNGAEPSLWISSFADNAGLSNEAAADLILYQASTQREILQELGVLRMDKYKIKNMKTKEETEQVFNTVYSAIIELEARVLG